MNPRWIDDLFYFLRKEYGAEIVYTKIGKGVVNYESGLREDKKEVFQIPAVIAPISLYQEYLDRFSNLGKGDSVDRAKTRILVRKSDLPITFDPDDYIVHGEHRYTDLKCEDLLSLWVVSGVATRFAPVYKTLQVAAGDNLGIADGV
jgi:hypothetical protein